MQIRKAILYFLFPFTLMAQKHHVSVDFNGNELEQVSWLEYPGLKTSQLFLTEAPVLSPQKRGYWFSPDVFNFHALASNDTLVFSAYQYNLDQNLVYDLALDFNSLIALKSDDLSIVKGVKPIESEQKGESACFFEGDSYIDLRGGPSYRMDIFTISLWIHPDQIDASQALVGKGSQFSMKIQKGHLVFTLPGIQDYAALNSIINADQWTHVSVVLSQNNQLYFYINGTLTDQLTIESLKSSNHALIIGSNFWGEGFQGGMQDLKIWTRDLSDDEILGVYGLEGSKPSLLVFVVVGFMIIIAIYLGGLFKQHPTKRKVAPKQNLKEGFGVYLLGGFRLLNIDGKEIQTKLSPKKRELFLVIYLNTFKQNGITSNELTALLWPGFDPSSAKNNRSTQMKGLRSFFKENGLPIEINFENKKWTMVFTDTSFHRELAPLNEILEQGSDHALLKWSSVIKKGNLLEKESYEWLDSFKAGYVDELLNRYEKLLDHEEAVDACLTLDPLFEEAVIKKIQFLKEQGKYGVANQLKAQFIQDFEKIYGEKPNI